MPYAATRRPPFTLTTGPVDCYPEVLRALAAPVLYDQDPAFAAQYESIALRTAAALGTLHPPVIVNGEAVLALEAAAASLIAPDDVVLNLASGVYGKGFGGWARRYAARVDEISVPYNEAIDPDAVRAHLTLHPETRIVCVCHHDTPSGTLNDIDAIGAIAAEAGALLIVDAVSSWAGMRTSPSACQAAIYVTGPNKCLGCPPGLSFAAISDAGWEKIAKNPAAPRASVLSLLDWKDAWQAREPFPFTPSSAEFNGLEAALTRYEEEGAEAVWARHVATAAAARAGIKALGLSLWPRSEAIAAPTCTTVTVPQNADAARVLANARARYGVTLSAGKGVLEGKLVRIGHMGPTAEPMYALVAVAALAGAFEAEGVRVDIAAGLAAVHASLGR